MPLQEIIHNRVAQNVIRPIDDEEIAQLNPITVRDLDQLLAHFVNYLRRKEHVGTSEQPLYN